MSDRPYAQLLVEEINGWSDPSAHFDPSSPLIRETLAGWSAKFDVTPQKPDQDARNWAASYPYGGKREIGR